MIMYVNNDWRHDDGIDNKINFFHITILAVHCILSSKDILDPSIITESILHLQFNISKTIASSSTFAWSDNIKRKINEREVKVRKK